MDSFAISSFLPVITHVIKIHWMLESKSTWSSRDNGESKHEDSHYAPCLSCYEREYALLVKDHVNFACIDDKHRIKVGEPGNLVSSAEHG